MVRVSLWIRVYARRRVWSMSLFCLALKVNGLVM